MVGTVDLNNKMCGKKGKVCYIIVNRVLVSEVEVIRIIS